MEDYLTTVTNMPVSQMENAYKYYTFFKKKFMFYSTRTLNWSIVTGKTFIC